MKTFCSYHPTTTAHFSCDECGKAFCAGCVSRREFDYYGKKKVAYFCPKCNIEANNLGMSNILPPFWKRLPDFFLYPLRIQPLVFILTITGLKFLFGSSFFFGIILPVIMLKYAYAVLLQTAQGKLEPPPLTFSLLADELEVVFKQVAVLLVIFIAGQWVFANFGPAAWTIYSLVAYLCLPAMIMALVATESLAQAINPLLFFRIISRIGGNYFLMYLFLLFLWKAPGILAWQVAPFLPGSFTKFVYFAAQNYYMVMVYNLMGYTLLQYHEEIGYQVEYDEKSATTAAATGPHQALLSEVEILLKEGEYDRAVTLIRENGGEEIADLQLAEKYYKLLKLTKAHPDQLKHSKRYLDLLAAAGRKAEAREVIMECLRIDKNYTPRPDTLFKMGKWLAGEKDPKLAMHLLVKFTRTYPDHPTLPDVYFLFAKLLHTRMNNHGKAKEVLEMLVKKYGDHPIGVNAGNYIRQMT